MPARPLNIKSLEPDTGCLSIPFQILFPSVICQTRETVGIYRISNTFFSHMASCTPQYMNILSVLDRVAVSYLRDTHGYGKLIHMGELPLLTRMPSHCNYIAELSNVLSPFIGHKFGTKCARSDTTIENYDLINLNPYRGTSFKHEQSI